MRFPMSTVNSTFVNRGESGSGDSRGDRFDLNGILQVSMLHGPAAACAAECDRCQGGRPARWLEFAGCHRVASVVAASGSSSSATW